MDTIKIGVFVIIACFLGIFMIVLLGGHSFRQTIRIETYIDESVQDLAAGSSVEYRGVEIGKVSNIGFVQSKYKIPDGQDIRYVLVEMKLFQDVIDGLADTDFPIWLANEVDAGMRVRITSQGLTGSAYLEIDYPKRVEPSSINLLWAPSLPYLPYTPSVTMRLNEVLDSVSSIAEDFRRSNFSRTIESVEKTFASIHHKIEGSGGDSLMVRIGDLLNDVSLTNKKLQDILEHVDISTVQNNLNTTIQRYEQFATAINEQKIPENFGELLTEIRRTNDGLNELVRAQEIRRVLQNSQETTAVIRELIVESEPDIRGGLQALRIAAEKISLTADDLGKEVSTGADELRTMIASLTELAGSLQALSSDIRQNPSRLLFSKPPPESFPNR